AKGISQRLGTANGTASGPDGYYDGYQNSNYGVLVPAFITAIEGRNAEKSSLGHNRKIPLPNWTIVYSGLTNIPFINKRFEVFEISRSEEHTSELQSRENLVCRLLLEIKNWFDLTYYLF